MSARLLGWAFALLLSIGPMMVGTPARVLAAPANDDIGNATVVAALPFTDTVDTSSATPAADDPQFCNGPPNNTVWYSLTPAQDAVITIDTFGSDYDTVLALYSGSRGSLLTLACNDNTATSDQSQISFRVSAGTRYYIEVDSCCGVAGTLTLHVNVAAPPANDNFANATPITSLPFIDQVDATGATGEPGEPLGPGCSVGPVSWSVWYAFTPAVSGSVTASAPAPTVAAYTGSSVSALTPVACANFGGPMTFFAAAGTTYHVQVGDFFNVGSPLTFRLDPAPAVQASFVIQPNDPSIFDGIRFLDTSTDPGGARFQSWAWTFGDGATAAGSSPVHQYAADGDYTVGLTVTTVDGRSASTTRTVHVATHDVAITAFRVPSTARAGRTRTITVEVRSVRYAETVQVELMRSAPGGGFETVARLTLPIPLQSRATPFDFSYLFTDGDAAQGKVTFEAVATIVGAHDAHPVDNTVIAPITTVSKR